MDTREILASIETALEQFFGNISYRMTLVNDSLNRQAILVSAPNGEIPDQSIISNGYTTIAARAVIGERHDPVILHQRTAHGKHGKLAQVGRVPENAKWLLCRFLVPGQHCARDAPLRHGGEPLRARLVFSGQRILERGDIACRVDIAN